MKRFTILIGFVCALGWLGFISGSCSQWYFNNSAGICESCPGCHRSGVRKHGCEDITGNCFCKKGYNGSRCDTCGEGFHGNGEICCNSTTEFILSKYKCQICGCNINGAYNTSCAGNGQCYCLPTHYGKQCNQCHLGRYLLPDGRCEVCGCNPEFSTNATCDPNDGQCTCKYSYTGRTCDDVKTQEYYLGNLGKTGKAGVRIVKLTCWSDCDVRAANVPFVGGDVDVSASDETYFHVGGGQMQTYGNIHCGGSSSYDNPEPCTIFRSYKNRKWAKVMFFYIRTPKNDPSRNVRFRYQVGNIKLVETVTKIN